MLVAKFHSVSAVVLLFVLLANVPVSAQQDSAKQAAYSKQADPFTAYLTVVPKVLDTLSTVQSGSGDSVIVTREIVYKSKNDVNRIYAIIASPQRVGKFPALLVLHGGSGNAKSVEDVVKKFARKGYVAMACDMAGYCDTSHTPHSSGPWKVHDAPNEAPRFDIAEGLQNSSLVDAEVAALNAFNLLRSQQNVDVKNIGITGYSWGGYSTTFLCGLLGDKVKAAYAYWGCGYYYKGSFWQKIIKAMPGSLQQQWLTYFDAGRRAPKIKANYFIEAASNDTYFWPDAVSATLNAIPANKNQVWGPNVNHSLTPTSAAMQELYFDYYLKGRGRRFVSAALGAVKLLPNGSKNIRIKLNVPPTIRVASVQLYYSVPTDKWESRQWVPVSAKKENEKNYDVVLPAELLSKKVNYFAYVTDSRGVVTSSAMF